MRPCDICAVDKYIITILSLSAQYPLSQKRKTHLPPTPPSPRKRLLYRLVKVVITALMLPISASFFRCFVQQHLDLFVPQNSLMPQRRGWGKNSLQQINVFHCFLPENCGTRCQNDHFFSIVLASNRV